MRVPQLYKIEAEMRRFTATLFLVAVLLVAGAAIADSDFEWQQIRPEQSRITFRAPGLEGGIKSFYKGRAQGAIHTQYLGRWVGPSGRSPNAEVVLWELAKGFSFRGTLLLKHYTKKLVFLEGKEVVFGNMGRMRNTLGRVRFMSFSYDSTECVSFDQNWRERGRGDRRLVGVYCTDATDGLSDENVVAILKGIGVRDVSRGEE